MREMVEQQDHLDLEVWSAVLQIERQLDALTSYRVAPERPELRNEYLRKRERLDTPIIALRTAIELAVPELACAAGDSWARRSFLAVLIMIDERELSNATVADALSSAGLFQTKYANIYDGGETFFSYVEQALRSRSTPALVLQLLLYCLRAGFCGRYTNGDAPERLAYLHELTDRVSPPQPSRIPPPADSATVPERIEGRRFPFEYYLIAALVLFCMWGGLKVSALTHEATQLGRTECIDE
jgi:hypothetical protein